jgi:anti-sigma-K factor RskA
MPPFETRPTRRRWSLGERLSAFTAVAALAVALLSGGLAFAERQQTERTTQQAARLAETLSVMYQPGMVWRLLQGTEEAPQSKGRVFFAPDTAHAVLMTYDLPKLPQHESYQFWLNNPEESRRVSGGTFTVDERGRGHLVVKSPDAIERFKACGVTREPVKGSASPTGPRMMAGQL